MHKFILAPLLLLSSKNASAGLAGEQLSLLWGLPFLGLLLSIALVPIISAKFWHHHYGKLTLFWALVFLLPFTVKFGLTETIHQAAHAIFLEYIPFIALLFSLYTVAGGICLRAEWVGTAGLNTTLLALGAASASVMGTTGAAMLLIRPLLNANQGRRYTVHVVIFFILLVGNIGGALTPLGDPPLFIGFLKGVDFFWTTRHLMLPMLLLSVTLLALFYLLDTYMHRREKHTPPIAGHIHLQPGSFTIEGKINFLLLIAIIGLVLASGTLRLGNIVVFDIAINVENIVKDIGLVAIALLSLALTPHTARAGNHFNWHPIVEVAKLFAGIFLTIIPVIAILQAGSAGALDSLVAAVSDDAGKPINAMYFWLTGLLSTFLDNAPTYLVFFNLAGGNAQQLMGPYAGTLLAISAGAVFFGALTYIGNAPNFLIKAIAEDNGVVMPSFFGYFMWASLILLPLFILLTVLFF